MAALLHGKGWRSAGPVADFQFPNFQITQLPNFYIAVPYFSAFPFDTLSERLL
jgi:hypothetical protein